MEPKSKLCGLCNTDYPLTEEYFYPARPRLGHKTQGWQSYCRACWKVINKANKARLQSAKKEFGGVSR